MFDDVNLRSVQNVHYELLHTLYSTQKMRGQQNDETAETWCREFGQLGDLLGIGVH